MRQIIVILVVLLLLSGCKNPQVVKMGTVAVEGDIEFKISDFNVRIIEVNEGKQTFGYARPVLAIPVQIKNLGKGAFSYVPTHRTQQMTESSTPLLYEDPGEEESLPPESKAPIMGIYLERGALKDQISKTKTINPGESIVDTFLFEVPDVAKNLIFSLPPTMHRGKLPVLFRIPFTPKDPTGPKIYKMGERVSFNTVELSVTHAYFENVKSSHSTQGKGQSTDKLLKIDYSLTNNSKQSILFDPAHGDLSGKGSNLFGADRAYKRVKFSTDVKVIGQLRGTINIEPGKSVNDFVLFDVNQENFKGATFEFPANLFARDGVARFNISLTDSKKSVKKAPKETTPKTDAGGVNSADMGTSLKADLGNKTSKPEMK